MVNQFLSHGPTCLRNNLWWIGSFATSDFLIAIAYISIPVVLLRFRNRLSAYGFKNNAILVGFSLFILGCGMTHLADIVTLWLPWYRLSLITKGFTATVSVWVAFQIGPAANELMNTLEKAKLLKDRQKALSSHFATLLSAEGKSSLGHIVEDILNDAVDTTIEEVTEP